ncbi:alpha/beta hydrolase [Allosaccharopolyspora coralli]|uniref:Alpha/beta hydrolase n=1 Tax=Allosaccharopolyspora coralli TaxID=2665642 RepID=A0A5Q3Q7G6_9PSEU|nr:alpha/beta hydrolase [Allosaccharopolyspora coralli]QGK70558.1 alpha/beta hydrolase [Allosaccharopolyspora coralli]
MSAPADLRHTFRPGTAEAPVLLLLHGTGGSPDDLRGLGEVLSPDAGVLAPVGPVSENGAARWFRRLREGVFDTEDVLARSEQLADFLVAARDEYDLGGRRMVAVGFSNGANIAAAVTLLRPDALQEAVLFSAMLPVPEPPQHDLSATRILLANGQRDPMAPMQAAQSLVAAYRQRGAEVDTAWHAGGHQITEDGAHRARDWLPRA